MTSARSAWTYLAVAPAVALLVVLFCLPFGVAFYDSLASGQDGHRVLSLARYVALLHDREIERGIAFSLTYATASTVAAFVYGSAFAAVMLHAFPGKRWFSALTCLPIMIPGVVVALAMLTLFEQGGILARAVAPFGVAMPRMVRDSYGMGAVIALAWKEAPLMGAIIASALASVRADIVGAARVFGASAWRAFWLVRLPAAMPGVAAAIVLGFVRALGAFAIPSLLGPAYPKPVLVLIYEAFESGDWPRAEALGVLFAAASVVAAWLYHRLTDAVRAEPAPGKTAGRNDRVA